MKVGVIGLGAMGAYMAINFNKAGNLHRIWNRTAKKLEALAEQTGVEIAQDPAALASVCDLILTCVSRDADVMEIVGHIADSVRPNTVVVDTSTISSETAGRAAALLAGKQAHFLDCPVSGGVEGAKNGTLAMMVGGDESVLERIRDTLSAIAGNIVYIGPAGSGQACKAVNQLMAAGINQAVTEALAFGEAMSLDMDRVIDVVSTGAAGNWFLSHRGKSMLAGSYTPGFKLALHHKDLTICQSMLQKLPRGTSLPILEMTLVHYQRLMDQGFGDEDISALYRLKKAQLLG